MARTKTTTQRGLGWRHRQDRDRLIRNHIDGTPCWWCNQPMHGDRNYTANWDNAKLEADHSTARSLGGKVADRLLHMTCNRQRGDGRRDHQRPAITGRQPVGEHETDPRVMPWPW